MFLNKISWRIAAVYILAQVVGAFVGVAASHIMFAKSIFSISHHFRGEYSLIFSEFVATFGLIFVILSCENKPNLAPFVIALYIVGAYWFTSSTSFANPAVTLARTTTDTFTGIRPNDALGFLIAQFMGAILSMKIFAWIKIEQ